jgi:hypothetical protein
MPRWPTTPASVASCWSGGLGSTGFLNDVWLWDGGWTPLGSAPQALSDPSMTYDQANSDLVLFGGTDGANGRTDGDANELDETWTFDGSTWTVKAPTTSPPVRADASMADDPSSTDATAGQPVLFGGKSGSFYAGGYDDTWTWNGTTWIQLSPATSPPGRLDATMSASATDQLVLFGGEGGRLSDYQSYADTWAWTGTTWVQQSPAASPSARSGPTSAYDTATDQLVLCGGQNYGSFPGPFNDTWVYGTPTPSGYWLVARDGGIFSYGSVSFQGSHGGSPLNQPIVGMAASLSVSGYWLVASDGGIFSYGDATFEGSHGGSPLNKPIVGMAATPDGGSYWLVASDGGIFSYGDASFFGSTGGSHLNKPIVGVAATKSGLGYWLVASDGGIFNYGNATFQGSHGGSPLNQPIVGMATG